MPLVSTPVARGPVVRATVVWAARTSAIAMALTIPLILAWMSLLVPTRWTRASAGGVAAGLVATGLVVSSLAGLTLFVVLRCTVLAVRLVRRSPGYPDRHWRVVGRAFRSILPVELILVAAGAGATVFAVLVSGGVADGAVPLASALDAIVVLFYLGMVLGMDDVLRHASVVPYFPEKVGEIETFSHGESLARHVVELDRVAGSIGLTPLSAFGWNDDMQGEPLAWHDAGEGLKTVDALLVHLHAEELAWADHDGLVDDLKRLSQALARAGGRGIPFSLLLRHSTCTSVQEWEVRRGTCF